MIIQVFSIIRWLIYGPITSVSIDNNDQRLINVGAKLSNLKKYVLDKEAFKENKDGKEKDTQPWVSVQLKVLNTSAESSLTNTKISLTEGDVVLDNGTSKTTQVPNNHSWTLIQVYFKADNPKDINFTLKIEHDGITEELPLTIRLHDASDVKITKVEPIGSNAEAVLDTKVENNKVTFDTYKYGMSSSIVDDEISRPYTLQFTTNVPVDSIKQKTGSSENASDWTDIATKTGDYTFTLPFDADKDTTIDTIILANEYGKESGTPGVPAGNSKKSVTITATEKSATELTKDSPVWASKIKKEPEISTLTGINVREDVNKDLLNGVFDKLESNEQSKDTLKTNAKESATLQNPTNKYDETNDSFTATLTVNSTKFGSISVDGEEGKWMLLHFACRGDIKNIVDENGIENGLYVDVANSSKLLTEEKLFGNTNSDIGAINLWRVPVWINLSNDNIKTAIAEEEPIEVKFGTKTPVEEHNSFFLKITDENKLADTSDIDEPKTPDMRSDDVGSGQEENNKKVLDKYFGNSSVDDNETKAKNLLKNAEKIQEITVTPNEDLIYVKVTYKGDLVNVDNCPVIPMTLDISPLKDVPGSKLMHKGKADDSWKDFFGPEKDYTDTTADFGFYLNNDAKIADGHYVKDLYIGKGESNEKLNSVLHYIIEFVQVK